MDRFILLFGFVAAVHSIQFDSCVEIAFSSRNCCTYFELTKDDEAILNECGQEIRDRTMCDYALCFGEKEGYITMNKTINRPVLQEFLIKKYENNSQIIDVVNEKCLTGDVDSYIQEDYCFLFEISRCVLLQTMMKCDKWKHSEECKDVKNIMLECEKNLPLMIE